MNNDIRREDAAGGLIRTVLLWGSLWGIFESTVGYLLHLLPVSLGWLVWYPVACFFMAMTYERARRPAAILCVGLLAACIKLLDLFLPVRIDMVLNPAVSIVFEALAMFCVVSAVGRLGEERRKKPLVIKALAVISMNMGWRVLYILYLLLLVPDWMREISVISSARQLTRHLVVGNLATSALIYPACLYLDRLLGLINKISVFRLPEQGSALKKLAVPCLLALNILLQILL